jgi:hypothetical protein
MPAISCQLSGKTRNAAVVRLNAPANAQLRRGICETAISSYDEGPRGYPGDRAAFMASTDKSMPILAVLPKLPTAKADSEKIVCPAAGQVD